MKKAVRYKGCKRRQSKHLYIHVLGTKKQLAENSKPLERLEALVEPILFFSHPRS